MHSRRVKGLAVGVCVGVAELVGVAGAQGADYAGDFSITNGNPNGDWTYGYVTSLAPGYTLVPYAATGSSAGINSWLGNVGGDGTPVATKNTTGATFVAGTVMIPAGEATLHPGPGGELSVARFTAPAAGVYNLNVVFSGYDSHGTTTDVHVLHNGASLFTGTVVGYQVTTSHSQLLNLAAGETVDFAVGTGNGDYRFDSTGVAATLVVPEPAGVGMGLVGVGAAMRRRRRGRGE